ncbi:unnamed protein product [Thlaspi arvense]|uniref:Uncharacterized protein n=1 Tax=Thlaspi arvense TaxID=13288 RepID=A0AAU9TA48_THLAR|nr:unnamed protein product [Thlaspi arvense]
MELPSSIGNAINLQKLNLSYCSNLVKLPSSIGNAINLKELCLIHCLSLVEFPSYIGNATNQKELGLTHCSRNKSFWQHLTEHLYTFEVDFEVEMTSNELVFEFKLNSDKWEIAIASLGLKLHMICRAQYLHTQVSRCIMPRIGIKLFGSHLCIGETLMEKLQLLEHLKILTASVVNALILESIQKVERHAHDIDDPEKSEWERFGSDASHLL